LKNYVISKGINILEAAASSIDDFLVRKACVSSTQLNRPIWQKRAYHHLETLNLQEVFLSDPNSILTGK
jgi:hypothetical protein